MENDINRRRNSNYEAADAALHQSPIRNLFKAVQQFASGKDSNGGPSSGHANASGSGGAMDAAGNHVQTYEDDDDDF